MEKHYGRSISVTDPPLDVSLANLDIDKATPSPVGTRKTRQVTSQSFKLRPTDHSSRKPISQKKNPICLPKLSIPDFDFSSIPNLKVLDHTKLKALIEKSDSIEETSIAILKEAEYPESLDVFYTELASLGDCNLRLETPLILSIINEHLALAILLICRPQAELDFCSISNESARKLIFSKTKKFHFDIQDLLDEKILGKFEEIQYHFGNHKPTGFDIRIDDNKLRIKRKVSEHVSQK